MATIDPVLPTSADRMLASEASRVLSPHVHSSAESVQIILPQEGENPQETVALPRHAFELLQNLLTEMSKGNAVSLVPQNAELTTNQAADVLGISRPYLVNELLKKQVIPYRKVGTHRRIAFAELMAYKNNRKERHEAAMQELADVSQEDGMGYE